MTDMDGNVYTFKAHLVEKGYTQTYDVIYRETVSPVADIRAIRILLAIAAFYDYDIWQMDVKPAFLNGHLTSGFNVALLILYADDILLMGKSCLPMTYYSWEITLQCFKKLNLGFQNPSKIHWTAVKTILKYLRNTKDMVLVYGAKPEAEMKVSCYDDASFQTDKDDTKSQTGYVFVLNGRAVDWKSAKQSNTAMHSIEAEYIVVVEASMEAVWMMKFIMDLEMSCHRIKDL
nr:putative retrotransposon protein [Tanacetum cinerariifolium]